MYGNNANPNGHGHNYVLEVTLTGDPDPVTGMVFDLRELKEILNREVVDPMDHRFLNKEVAPFDRVIPTTENLAVEIWKRIEPQITRAGVRLQNVRLYETPDLYVDYGGGLPRPAMRLTTRYRFSASHRLDTPTLSPEENRKLYGKCNNPHGHGHDYVLDITVDGPVDQDGQVVNREAMDALVRERVLGRLDHRNLNADIPELAGLVTTTENVAELVRDALAREWTLPARLARVRISETARNTFELEVPKG